MDANYIKIMPDYECSPLWIGVDGHVRDNIDIEALICDSELISEFNDWDDSFQKIYNRYDIEAIGFSDKIALFEFEKTGISLWCKLCKLKSDMKIEYMSIVFNEIYENPQELMYDLCYKTQNIKSFAYVRESVK
jgi:hypothetical protein